MSPSALRPGVMSMWTIYADNDNGHVAMRWLITQDGPVATSERRVASLDEIRAEMERDGRTRVGRASSDPENVVETWI